MWLSSRTFRNEGRHQHLGLEMKTAAKTQTPPDLDSVIPEITSPPDFDVFYSLLGVTLS